ncbi:MAG: hypothetical protein E6F94_12240 [Actinobacteria bacterium]|nr:MAG: hypothetical protein E6G38_04455 [Actinomycetota bacterium]TMM23001.1 MAG: hypothetical protein E6F94_12240 [Actinomycetota bacterium]
MRRLAPLLLLLPLVAGCSSSGSKKIAIQPAKVYRLAGFRPVGSIAPRKPTTVAFTIDQPSGSPLTAYRTGPGPHTGIHLIIVRDDLSTIIHRHPPMQPGGRFEQQVVFPAPGRYRVIVDVYPRRRGPVPNFQLFKDLVVRGVPAPAPLGGYQAVQHVGGFTFTAPRRPDIRAIQSTLMTVHVSDAAGKPARFVPWFGALAHAIFFHVGTLDYFHTHVCAPNATGCTSLLAGAKVTGRSSAPGKLTIGILLPTAGTWKLFLQAKPDGRLVTVPYVLKAR